MARERSHVSSIAGVVQRLAVLLAAGVPPAAAWGYLRESEGIAEVVAEVAARSAAGDRIPEVILRFSARAPALDRSAWQGLSAAWFVASDSGSPLAPTLRQFASSLRDVAQSQREIRVALAGPVATARLVVALPLIGMLFGLVLGFDTPIMLATTPLGWACLAVGGALLALAWLWNRRLVRSAQPTDLTPGLSFDLMAIAVSGGGSLQAAQLTVATALEASGLGESTAPRRVGRAALRKGSRKGQAAHQADTDGAELTAVLDLSRRAGVPAGELLRSEAEECRREVRALMQERAAALAIRLLLPLGVCVLPAFMVLAVVPLLVTVVQSTTIS